MNISNETLQSLKDKGIKIPEYDRKSLKPSIVHIGLGHFHRSHFLTYMDELLRNGDYDGGVFEVDIIPSRKEFIDSLRKQDYLYSVLSIAPDGKEELRINGPIVGYANHAEDPESVMVRLSSPETTLITLTITEKGYCYRDDIGSIDWDNADIRHDIETSDPPRTAIGCLAEALSIRCRKNLPVTIMSCDNVPENGKMLRSCMLQFCRKKYPEIAGWVESSVAFPCTMVDRITPGTSAEDILKLKTEYGLDDECPVHSESFMQWVIEDNHCTPVPDFSKAGALIADDVKPYELMKIRLLNGSHSALSYPAYMMGHKMVHEAATDPVIRKFIREHYMEEIAATLPPVPGVDISEYKDDLILRFSNPYIADTILRLASDGSKKISNAILRPLEEGVRRGICMDHVVLALALWNYYFIFRDDEGNPMPIDDPKGNELAAASTDPALFLRIAGLSDDVIASSSVVGKIRDLIQEFREGGIGKTIQESCR